MGLGLLAANWWIVQAYLTGREQAVASACRGTPFADGAVLAAGGPDAITTPDDAALAGYRDPEARAEAARRIRDRASLLGDDDLAAAATSTMVFGPFASREAIGEVERSCRRYLDRHGDG